MKIVFTTQGPDWSSPMDARFGRARYFLVFDEDKNELEVVDNGEASQAAHGAGPMAAKKVLDIAPQAVVTGNGPGGNAAVVLEKSGIDIYVGAGEMSAQEALDAYRAGSLKKS